jgi:hypothetical protein
MWFNGTASIFVAGQTHYNFTVGCEGIVHFYHKFNFDSREDAAGAITIWTEQTGALLTELLVQNRNRFQKFQDRNAGCQEWTSTLGVRGGYFNCNTQKCHSNS